MSPKRDDYIVRRGARVRVTLPKGTSGSGVESPAAGDEPKMLRPSDEDEELYAFRKGGISFYDLGTRKVEDSDAYEYVLIPSFLHEGFVAYDDLRTRYNAALLSGDFTAKSACLKLKQESEFLYVDALFRKADDLKRKIVGNKDARPFVKDFPEEGAPAPAMVNETSFKKGSLQFTGSGFSMGVEAAFFYNTFDTSDADNFKVTNEPDPASAAVEFKTDAKPLRVYLTPRMIYDTEDEGDVSRFRMFRFLPVLPDFEAIKSDALAGIIHTDQSSDATASADFWSAIGENFSASVGFFPPFFSMFDSASAFRLAQETGAPVLAAVIVKGAKKFYVWRTSSGDSLAWSYANIYNPNP